jgi:hypothetical protein
MGAGFPPRVESPKRDALRTHLGWALGLEAAPIKHQRIPAAASWSPSASSHLHAQSKRRGTLKSRNNVAADARAERPTRKFVVQGFLPRERCAWDR